MMKSNVYKLTEIDDEIIDLYIECFKKDKIFTCLLYTSDAADEGMAV